ncbi:hypothetical protein HDU82_008269 [Entophlyctis luteolus]|nr:hypothetical protein HDU82_008269 [Entophlyctis luteolus]
MAGGGTYDDGGVLTLGIVIAEIIVDMNRADLQSIVVKFRSLESLSLENSKGQKTQISHRSLKRLTASNFELVLRSLQTCPNLQDVKIPFEFGGHSSRRSLGTLSDAGKNLKHVWIENPDFRGEPSGLIVYFETLSLGAISAEALSAVPTWFTQNKFPGLKHLELDGDFLQLPSKAISSLTYIALETLNLKFFSFEPSHMFDIAEHLQALEHLSFEGCDISAYSERAEEQPSYATLVSKEFLDVFSNSFKYLESFKCFGCPSVPLAKDFQESLNLCIENHRLLSGLYVTVLGPTVGGIKKHEKSHQLMGLNGERTRHIAEIHSDDLKRRFWWLKEVSVFIFDA